MSGSSSETTEKHRDVAELTETELHSLLAAERRRLTLDVLAGQTTPIDLGALAAGIAARERGNDLDEETIEQVAVSLHHVHLPRMADLDVIDYDATSHQIDPSKTSVDAVYTSHFDVDA